jgi:predicted nucleic acid-binding Zn ribbon protein
MMQFEHYTRNCLSCEKALRGRVDKKFCDDYCRSNYNYRQKSTDSGLVRLINNALARNRKILQSFLSTGKETARATRDQLLLRGFSFKYHTQSFTNRTGNTYYYSYDFGYRVLENDWYLVVRNKEEQH